MMFWHPVAQGIAIWHIGFIFQAITIISVAFCLQLNTLSYQVNIHLEAREGSVRVDGAEG